MILCDQINISRIGGMLNDKKNIFDIYLLIIFKLTHIYISIEFRDRNGK